MASLYQDWDADKESLWKEWSKDGKRSFIIRFGIMRWGAWMFFWFMLFSYFMESKSGDFGIPELVDALLFNSLVWPITGWFYANTIWNATNASYAIYKSKDI